MVDLGIGGFGPHALSGCFKEQSTVARPGIETRFFDFLKGLEFFCSSVSV